MYVCTECVQYTGALYKIGDVTLSPSLSTLQRQVSLTEPGARSNLASLLTPGSPITAPHCHYMRLPCLDSFLIVPGIRTLALRLVYQVLFRLSYLSKRNVFMTRAWHMLGGGNGVLGGGGGRGLEVSSSSSSLASSALETGQLQQQKRVEGNHKVPSLGY